MLVRSDITLDSDSRNLARREPFAPLGLNGRAAEGAAIRQVRGDSGGADTVADGGPRKSANLIARHPASRYRHGSRLRSRLDGSRPAALILAITRLWCSGCVTADQLKPSCPRFGRSALATPLCGARCQTKRKSARR